MRKGRVSLIGAGPGDPDLLTLKAQKRLREADLIIYDYLVNPEHLMHASSGSKKIGVGQGFRHKKLSQEKIERMIIEHARKGKYVVRLKGGDPYLFGRGGEEALLMADRNIPFEVIPGVTSATGCATYAGIPLTHRDHNTSVTFITGHRADDAELESLDWSKIASLRGTLVIYMGFYNLRKITGILIRHGMGALTPVAVVEWGTLPRQRSEAGTLADIADKVEGRRFQAPCIIIIGDVVRLREKLNWFERLPLFGKRILVTRMREKAGALSERFRAMGASVIEFPVIEIQKRPDTGALTKALRDISRYDWVLFTSAYGVESLFDHLSSKGKDARSLSGVKIGCVGPATASALASHGLRADIIPSSYQSRALADALRRSGSLEQKRVLLLRTDIATTELEQSLKRSGARTTAVTVYRTRGAKVSRAMVEELLSHPPDIVCLASGSAARHFSAALGPANAKKLAARSRIASIGPVTSHAARKAGMRPSVQAKRSTLEGLVDAVQKAMR